MRSPFPAAPAPPSRQKNGFAALKTSLNAAIPAFCARTRQKFPISYTREVVEIAALAAAPVPRAAVGFAARAPVRFSRRLALPAETPIEAAVALAALVGVALLSAPR